MSAATARPRSRARSGRGSILVAALAMLSVLLLMPTASTSAQFQASLPAAAGSAGTGAWCISPDPATNPAYIRLSDVPALTATPTTRMAIIPVANTTVWNPAGGNKNLAARVWSCQDPTSAAMVNDSLKVMGWANAITIPPRTWSVGSDAVLAPTSRLNPNTAGSLGAQLATLSTAASVDATAPLLVPTGDLRRYSWMVGGNRTNAAPTADPPQCTWATSLLLASCVVSTTAVPFSSAFSANPWAGSTTAPVTYPARTLATVNWGGGGAYLNGECGVLGLLLCGSVPLNTTMTATTAATTTLYASSSGNTMSWVVVMWTGTTAPPVDLVVEIVLQ
ncbi:hypothetical protein [Plantibacter sp. YIM 135249]|uniref:hypothetical protein n=1 Tax=Plantibacter sp. YIM 135249 TaxID=3423918 RepID=UPI003D327578